MSKWEEKYEKSYVESEKTFEESLYYIWCMCLEEIDYDEFYLYLTEEILLQVDAYIKAKHTATKVPSIKNGTGKGDKITSELVYYWMLSCQIPFEADKWNFNRLLALIEICNFKSQPPKKKSQAQMLAERKELNEQRLREMRTNG